jgi:lysophospholipase L1-like esterase
MCRPEKDLDLSWFLRRAEDGGELTVLGLGDSLTYGWMVDRGFFDRFVDELERRYPRTIFVRRNAGVPGDTAAGGLLRLDELLEESPDLALIQFGVNDLFSGEDPVRFGSTVARIAYRIMQDDGLPLLTTSCPVNLGAKNDAATPFYDAIRQAGELLGVPVASLEKHWQERLAQLDDPRDLFLGDQVHPNDEGHALMAQGLLQLLESAASSGTK